MRDESKHSRLDYRKLLSGKVAMHGERRGPKDALLYVIRFQDFFKRLEIVLRIPIAVRHRTHTAQRGFPDEKTKEFAQTVERAGRDL